MIKDGIEKIVNGILCFSKGGKWTPFSSRAMTVVIRSLRNQLDYYQVQCAAQSEKLTQIREIVSPK